MADTQTETTEMDVLVKTAVEKIESGAISMSDLLKALSPTAKREVETLGETPLPAAISPDQREALEKVGKVFGAVVPDQRRMLKPAEVTALIDERQTLDEIRKMAESRNEGIRATIFNHLDVEVEEQGAAEEAQRDAKGHYLVKGEVRGTPDTDHRFTREIRNSSPSLDASALEALAKDDEYPDFTWDDYLSMTTQTRVMDENKVMLALKKNPHLVTAIAKATRPGGTTASMYLRKA